MQCKFSCACISILKKEGKKILSSIIYAILILQSSSPVNGGSENGGAPSEEKAPSNGNSTQQEVKSSGSPEGDEVKSSDGKVSPDGGKDSASTDTPSEKTVSVNMYVGTCMYIAPESHA